MRGSQPNQEHEFLDITAVMVFTLFALGFGGFSLFSLLDLVVF